MEITRTAKNTMPEQVQENMDNIDALNNELDSRPVGLIDKGDWTRGRHYYPQQVVQYNGASYLCTRSIISYATPDTDPAHFKLFAAGTQGEQGETGNGIASITKISTVGLVDTYRITFTDGTTYDYTVTNGQNGTNGTNGQDGNGIASITKISTVGLVDTYRITFTDGTTYEYTVTNGQNGTDGTKIYVNGVEQTSLSFNSDPQTQLDGKQDTLTFDNTPTENSTNPVTSGGIYNAINREFIEAYTKTEIRLTANTWTNVGSNANLTVINSNGNKLTMNASSRRIIIGNDVSKVKIYAKARFYCNATNTRFQVALYKNGVAANAYVDYGSADCKMQYVQFPVNFTCIVNVNENDELSFSVISSNSNASNKDGLQNNTVIIVEVIK